LNYWLIKSEPEAFSIDDLAREKKAHWDGVRNYQARNYMRDKMKSGDLALFYHSSTEPPGVAGIARTCSESYPDFTSWDRKSDFYDPKSNAQHPAWFMVDIEFIEKFHKYVTLEQLKLTPELQGMLVTRKGMRLSIQPVQSEHFKKVKKMGGSSAA